MKEFLRIANLKKVYKINDDHVQKVLNGITLDFYKGELVSLLGESGSGKSTLLNIIGGLDKDFTGSVVYKGKYMSDYTEKQLDIYHKRSIGFVFQNYNLVPHMTLLQNVEIAMVANGVSEEKRRRRALDLLKMVGLLDEKNKLPNQLSGGQKQRVAIARALANNPSIILADEPTGALDKESAEVIFNILKEIAASGKLVIIVTHSEAISNKCSRVVKIEEGLVLSDKTLVEPVINEKEFDDESNRFLTNKDNFKIALGNIIRNKARNITICIGVAISIISMILILNLSDGLTDYVVDYYNEDSKSTQLIVTKGTNFSDFSDSILDMERIDGVDFFIPNEVFTTSSVDGVSVSELITYKNGYAPNITYGVDISTSGEVIISELLASSLFDKNVISALGQTITIKDSYNELDVKIVGLFNVFDNNSIYALESDLDTIYSDISKVNHGYLKIRDLSMISYIEDELNELGLTVTQESYEAQTIIDYIYLGANVLTGVSAASMVVGAIMIYIVLYICVVERTKEIGVFRAIGFEKRDIRKMFTYEAFIIGISSGVIGSLLCIVLTILVNIVTNITMDASLIGFNILYYLLGILVSTLVSVFSGLSPAIQASELDPISSLRYE